MSFNVVLYKPEIPQNTGNIGRLCVNSGSVLHIVGTPSFDLSAKAVRRAGLDYWQDLHLVLHKDWSEFSRSINSLERVFLVSRFGEKKYYHNIFYDGDYLLFGNETSGVPAEIRNCFAKEKILKIPMKSGSRSLNLSNAAAVVLYEGIRQTGILEI